MRMLLVATLAVVLGCEAKRPAGAPGAGVLPLERCGVSYTAPSDWTVADPLTNEAYRYLARVGPSTSMALFESPGGTRIRITCTRAWARGTILTEDGTAATGFDDFVARSHAFVADSGLSSQVDRTPLTLAGGTSLPFTEARIARGAVGGTSFAKGFGALHLATAYLVIDASGDPDRYDRAEVEAFVATVTAR